MLITSVRPAKAVISEGLKVWWGNSVWSVIYVPLSTAVCTKLLIGTKAPGANATGRKLTTAMALGKRRRGLHLEQGPRS